MASEKLNLRMEIDRGPSKFDLMGALFEGDASNRRPVRFRVNQIFGSDSSHWCSVVIDQVTRDRASNDEDWVLGGQLLELEDISVVKDGEKIPIKNRKLSAFCFSTKTRKGYMTIE